MLDDYLVDFRQHIIHRYPPGPQCGTQELDDGEKAVRVAEQMPEYKALGYTLCRVCDPKLTWPK